MGDDHFRSTEDEERKAEESRRLADREESEISTATRRLRNRRTVSWTVGGMSLGFLMVTALPDWVRYIAMVAVSFAWVANSRAGASLERVIVLSAKAASARADRLERENASLREDKAKLEQKAREGVAQRALLAREQLAGATGHSRLVFWLGTTLAAAAVAAPSVAAWVIVTRGLDWHYLLGGLSGGAIALSGAVALLRHDRNLRSVQTGLQDQISLLERMQIAMDLAEIEGAEFVKETRRKMVHQLIERHLMRPTAPIEEEAVDDALPIAKVTDALLPRKE